MAQEPTHTTKKWQNVTNAKKLTPRKNGLTTDIFPSWLVACRLEPAAKQVTMSIAQESRPTHCCVFQESIQRLNYFKSLRMSRRKVRSIGEIIKITLVQRKRKDHASCSVSKQSHKSVLKLVPNIALICVLRCPGSTSPTSSPRRDGT